MKERSPKTKQGVFAPQKEELSKGRGNCVENAGIEKARIPCDCLFLSYQGYKSVLTDSPFFPYHLIFHSRLQWCISLPGQIHPSHFFTAFKYRIPSALPMSYTLCSSSGSCSIRPIFRECSGRITRIFPCSSRRSIHSTVRLYVR